MLIKHFFIELLLVPFKILLGVKSNSNIIPHHLNTFLIIWPNHSFGLFLSGRILFRAIKEKFPNSKITLLTNDQRIKQFYNAGFFELLGFDTNDKIIGVNNPVVFFSSRFDVAIVPTIEKFSAFNHFIMRFSKSKIRIGIASLENKKNPYSFLFDKKVESNLTNVQDTHISELFLETLKPFEIHQSALFPEINNFEITDSEKNEIRANADIAENQKIIVINNEPEEIQNKWSVENLVMLISLLVQSGDYYFYYIEDKMDPIFKSILESDVKILHYVNKNDLNKLKKIFSICDLVITCDSNIMHFAGLTHVPQISIFGISNPFNWAPLGPNKKFIKKSDLINEISANDVFELAQSFLKSGTKNE